MSGAISWSLSDLEEHKTHKIFTFMYYIAPNFFSLNSSTSVVDDDANVGERRRGVLFLQTGSGDVDVDDDANVGVGERRFVFANGLR